MGASIALAGSIGLPDWLHTPEEWKEELVTGMEAILLAARAETGADEWDQAYREGQSMSLDRAVAEALGPWDDFPDTLEVG